MTLCFQKSLDEQRGCVLKFSGELDHVSREDFHKVFAEHAQIKWIDFTRGAKEVSEACSALWERFLRQHYTLVRAVITASVQDFSRR